MQYNIADHNMNLLCHVLMVNISSTGTKQTVYWSITKMTAADTVTVVEA